MTRSTTAEVNMNWDRRARSEGFVGTRLLSQALTQTLYVEG